MEPKDRKINMMEMSSKINKMESQFKEKNVKHLFSSGSLDIRSQEQGLQFRKDKH